MQKPHLFFRNPKDGVVALRQLPRYSGNGDEDEGSIIEKDYTFLKETLKNSRRVYLNEVIERNRNRNPNLEIPEKFDCILIEFFDYFNIGTFETKYRNDFGLTPVKYFEFNTVGLFAVADEDKFRSFLGEIEKFAKSNDSQNDSSFDRKLLYIKGFSFFSSKRRIRTDDLKEYVNLELTDNIELIEKIISIEKSLLNYLQARSIPYKFSPEMNRLEIFNSNQQLINEIINNFDVVQSVNSPLAGVVKPSTFNLPVKEYGFTINNSSQSLPIIGIIDTGISNQTPLAPLIINNGNEFDVTGTDPVIDEADHGTSVAALAALGPSLIPSHIGSFNADAKLLSIKVLNGSSGFVSQTDVIELIKSANRKYGVKVFVLTIGYSDRKELNSEISNYAYSLDVLADDLDILIFISAGNNNDQTYFDEKLNSFPYIYPDHFRTKNSVLCVPADSINNISCGATSGNFEAFDYVKNISHGPDFPASYTPKFYIQQSHPFFKGNRFNHQFIKPDLCYNAGDFDKVDLLQDNFGIKVISAIPGLFYSRIVGTSFSAPLLANIAAKLIRLYPELRMQTVKALLMNSALLPKCGDFLKNIQGCKIEHLMGRGIPDATKCIYSDENRITLLLEDSIEPDEFKSYPLRLPEYLNHMDKDRSLLNISATLCFSIKPVQNSHLAYCPLNISFGFFKNIDIEAKSIDAEGKELPAGLNGNKASNIQLKSTLRWSQDYYYKPKILSNSQKLTFTISKADLINETNQIKLAIKCQKHKLLPEYLSTEYNGAHSFSICIMIEENPVKGKLSGKLYDELVAINELEAIARGDIELEADTEI